MASHRDHGPAKAFCDARSAPAQAAAVPNGADVPGLDVRLRRNTDDARGPAHRPQEPAQRRHVGLRGASLGVHGAGRLGVADRGGERRRQPGGRP
jgi:hypothetical protein